MAVAGAKVANWPPSLSAHSLHPDWYMKILSWKILLRSAISIALLTAATVSSLAITRDEDDYRFEVERRLNAHGDEFMALAQSTDGRFLIVGAESGKLLIWSIAERRIVKQFLGVHAVAGGFIYKRDNNLVLAKSTDGTTVRQFAIEGELHGFSVSANGEWMVAANETGSLFRFDIKKGTRSPVSAESINSLTGLTISNDGRYVYTTEFGSTLRQWDTQTSLMKEMASIRGQARTLRLSRDEKEIAIGGNHRDVAVYDIATGERRLYFEITASDFYVTNVWLGGDRLLFSTDAGVLYDGRVKR